MAYPINRPSKRYYIPEGVKTTRKYSFFNSQTINEVIIPSTIETIDDYTFKNCTNIYDIYYIKGSGLTTEGTGIFDGITTFKIRVSKNIQSTIPTIKGKETTSDLTVGVSGATTRYMYSEEYEILTIYEEGNMTDYDETQSPWYSLNEGIETVMIESGISKISESSFYELTELKKIEVNTHTMSH